MTYTHILPPSLRTGLLAALMLLTSVIASQPAVAQGTALRIAAVVNDEIISVLDLDIRISLTIFGAGMPNNQETRQRLAAQVLRGLIDERLQMQEARRLNITVSEAEINEAIRRIEGQNRMQPGSLLQSLRQQGIPPQTLNQQITATLSWRRVVSRRFVGAAEVSDEEINEQLAQLESQRGKPESLVKEILLPVDSPEREDEVRAFAERMLLQLRDGASFEGLAQQFSQSASARTGGDIGWIAAEELDEPLSQALNALQPGQVSSPVRTVLGYYLLKLEDRRIRAQAPPSEARVTLTQMPLPVLADTPPEQVDEIASKMRMAIPQANACGALESVAAQFKAPAPLDLGTLRQGDLSPLIQRAIANLEVGQASDSVALPGGAALIVLCGREATISDLPSRPEIRQRLENEKLEVLARRLMRDLRRAAFVDIRI
ncbi:MAG: peptidylprolyl isomerase [Alphaproteobacteria bacterium]|nr:peptidylprolyl isomerase [Alphaproteobacteria bacterium]MBU0796675.1 peptidylprolyl isomerase [Alphaproteobacteria bacterium]MBU0888224.1 peptidylprolyl isomerase [Alphaproteobacteria bacterium]MBU1811425.1 peptidylprolyl isomerase [Alphaproteobacteria bacterium]